MLIFLAFFALGVVVAPLTIGAALSLGATWRWVFVGEAAQRTSHPMALVAQHAGVDPIMPRSPRDLNGIRKLRRFSDPIRDVGIRPGR